MISFLVNDRPVAVDVPPMSRLLDLLREDLRLTGSKEGCGEGECGACTVLMDGEPVCACLVPAIQAQGARILTVEGLARDGRLDPVQSAFLAHGATQCGICTPGLLVMARALLDREPHPSPERTRAALAGNLCRCTGYQKVIDAVVDALSEPPAPAGEARQGEEGAC